MPRSAPDPAGGVRQLACGECHTHTHSCVCGVPARASPWSRRQPRLAQPLERCGDVGHTAGATDVPALATACPADWVTVPAQPSPPEAATLGAHAPRVERETMLGRGYETQVAVGTLLFPTRTREHQG